MLWKLQCNFHSFTLVYLLYKMGVRYMKDMIFLFVVINLFSFKSNCSNSDEHKVNPSLRTDHCWKSQWKETLILRTGFPHYTATATSGLVSFTARLRAEAPQKAFAENSLAKHRQWGFVCHAAKRTRGSRGAECQPEGLRTWKIFGAAAVLLQRLPKKILSYQNTPHQSIRKTPSHNTPGIWGKMVQQQRFLTARSLFAHSADVWRCDWWELPARAAVPARSTGRALWRRSSRTQDVFRLLCWHCGGRFVFKLISRQSQPIWHSFAHQQCK